MALIVTHSDMQERGYAEYSTAALAAVSAAIQDAAGSPIVETTATIRVPGSVSAWLDVPGPVRSVAAVSVDDSALSADDYRVWPDRLWRRCGWGGPEVPVTVTYTMGATPPADVVQLACELVMLVSSGEFADPRVESEGVDDYRVTYRDGGVSAVELPQATRDRLRARFSGGGVYSIGSR